MKITPVRSHGFGGLGILSGLCDPVLAECIVSPLLWAVDGDRSEWMAFLVPFLNNLSSEHLSIPCGMGCWPEVHVIGETLAGVDFLVSLPPRMNLQEKRSQPLRALVPKCSQNLPCLVFGCSE